jgi:hypothetical protein
MKISLNTPLIAVGHTYLPVGHTYLPVVYTFLPLEIVIDRLING